MTPLGRPVVPEVQTSMHGWFVACTRHHIFSFCQFHHEFFFMFADSIMNIMRITHIVQVMNIMLIKRSTLYNWLHPLLRNLIVSYFAYVSNQMLHQNIDYQMNYENKTPSALFLETSILLPELIIFPQECHRPSS